MVQNKVQLNSAVSELEAAMFSPSHSFTRLNQSYQISSPLLEYNLQGYNYH